MERNEYLEKINEIAKDVFDNDDAVITEASTANDVDGWDSLTHLELMTELEAEYRIKFTMSEIQNLADVGELIDCIIKHQA
ncbi:MAG: acyl carrier protein [Lachnospiraceae bacterium]